MNGWLASLSPRAQGTATLGVALAVGAAGWLVAHLLRDRFYPVIWPGAGLLVPIGLFQLITGYSREDLQRGRIPRGLALGLLLGCVVGVALGLEANRAWFGVRW